MKANIETMLTVTPMPGRNRNAPKNDVGIPKVTKKLAGFEEQSQHDQDENKPPKSVLQQQFQTLPIYPRIIVLMVHRIFCGSCVSILYMA